MIESASPTESPGRLPEDERVAISFGEPLLFDAPGIRRLHDLVRISTPAPAAIRYERVRRLCPHESTGPSEARFHQPNLRPWHCLSIGIRLVTNWVHRYNGIWRRRVFFLCEANP